MNDQREASREVKDDELAAAMDALDAPAGVVPERIQQSRGDSLPAIWQRTARRSSPLTSSSRHPPSSGTATPSSETETGVSMRACAPASTTMRATGSFSDATASEKAWAIVKPASMPMTAAADGMHERTFVLFDVISRFHKINGYCGLSL